MIIEKKSLQNEEWIYLSTDRTHENMENNFFNEREAEGRLKWLNLNMKDIITGKKTVHFTEDPYEDYDFDMTATTALSYGEIKTVHRPYAKYPDFQIDYRKMKSLQDRARNEGRIPYLVCFFDDADMIWDISSIDLEGRRYSRFCTSTTASYTRGKKEKEEVWFKAEEALYVRKNKETV